MSRSAEDSGELAGFRRAGGNPATLASTGVRELFSNSASLLGTTAITSGLGFVFWTVAARSFSASEVGLGSAAVSAMGLIASLSTLGLGTLLMGELAIHPRSAPRLISSALVISASIGAIAGGVFAMLAPTISDQLADLGSSPQAIVLFAAGVLLATAALVVDQALVGLMKAGLQLRRNAVFAVAKLIALAGLISVGAIGTGLNIYAAWILGTGASIVALTFTARPRFHRAMRPGVRELVGDYGSQALEHHVFNLALQIPVLVLPVIVAASVSNSANGLFYIALMIATFLWMVPIVLATVLFPSTSADPGSGRTKLLLTTRVSLGVGVAACILIWLFASPMLSFFGDEYQQAAWPLRILVLQVFPITVKTHYVAVTRIARRFGRAIPIVWVGSFLEVSLASVALSANGIVGLSIGWLIALLIEATVMSGRVAAATRMKPS